jgi:hypothetical protein
MKTINTIKIGNYELRVIDFSKEHIFKTQILQENNVLNTASHKSKEEALNHHKTLVNQYSRIDEL